ncbi:MAG TPA: flagellar assembly protein FliH [Thiobacillus sp.]|nr:flagellar assembly protein FliH [Thiobacillus sp.]
MSSVISTLDRSDCKPWEMASFEGDPHSMKESHRAGITLPTIEQISGIQEQARQEGYNAGHAEGLAKGYGEGQKKAALEAARLGSLADAFTTAVGNADETIAQHILDLALDFSHALLKSALTIRPELVIPIVKEAVRYLPMLHQPALLFLNPDDVVLVGDRIGDELTKMGWQLTADAELEPGSCRVETANNQIDASLPTRWKRLAAALGKDSDWLAA